MGEYVGKQADLTEPASGAAAVTPSDDTDLTYWALALYVGSSGDVTLNTWDETAVTITNVPIGILPIRTRRVLATGTTASGIVALW